MKFTTALITLAIAAVASANKFPVPSGLTVQEASSKCGDKAQIACCNNVKYGGDSTVVQEGIAAGLLTVIGVDDLINQKCKQNIACCAQSPRSASDDLVGATLPCIALGSILKILSVFGYARGLIRGGSSS
ncbi:uncharacterized protein BDV17DRAFT_295960 [Aspergillus undulatus]|uniref:uncharacterized protein n=1 Tax=Aspergillus undulatus TaxID=1810928 RepID=UPI003CCD4060